MAKLYAELTSDKGGRVVGKGGNESLSIKIRQGNKIIYYVDIQNDGEECPQIIVSSQTGTIFEN